MSDLMDYDDLMEEEGQNGQNRKLLLAVVSGTYQAETNTILIAAECKQIAAVRMLETALKSNNEEDGDEPKQAKKQKKTKKPRATKSKRLTLSEFLKKVKNPEEIMGLIKKMENDLKQLKNLDEPKVDLIFDVEMSDDEEDQA